MLRLLVRTDYTYGGGNSLRPGTISSVGGRTPSGLGPARGLAAGLRSRRHAIQAPRVRDALQLVLSGIFEDQAASGGQVFDGL